MVRRLLYAALALGPLLIVLDHVAHLDENTLFVLSALALVPLAWLIGEATEHAGEHTGPGIGGFLNATFGNAPELIIALLAISQGLPNVVRGSLAGSVASNILLVLGVALAVGRNARIDLRSLTLQLVLVVFATLAFLVPSIPGFHGDPERHALVLLTIPVAIVLLGLYVATTIFNLQRHAAAHTAEASEQAWSLPRALAVLGATTLVTALISEILVHSLAGFAETAGLSEFFIAVVIVAIVAIPSTTSDAGRLQAVSCGSVSASWCARRCRRRLSRMTTP